jgi:hypothetical protein
MPTDTARCFPIIYVRGYAMSQHEQDETTADPFNGFNLGSTVYRATTDRDRPKKFIFESPLLRLTTDHGYAIVYRNGLDLLDPDWPGPFERRSVVIYRYYDEASTLLGVGKTPPIDVFAKGLNTLILKVRELACNNPANGFAPETFRCYLVAHSMGGLICRAFLQNPDYSSDEARRTVDKVFTYATPHNGIEMAGLNVPSWLTKDDMDNFNRDVMAKYLGLESVRQKLNTDRVDFVEKELLGKFFCMVGTNRDDYQVAMGVSRTFAGNGSDGLVRIENATVWGIDGAQGIATPCATAYCYRSHSGFFGIVNSEEAYQNLTRFLFGDLRVDIWVDLDDVVLPPEIADKDVDAVYQFELLTSPRGKRWYLSRRIAEEDSVACRTHKQLMSDSSSRSIFLSTVFLSMDFRMDKSDPSLTYSLTMGARVPDYEVERKFWFDRHVEGAYLFRDTLVVSITPPAQPGEDATANWDWLRDSPEKPSRKLELQDRDARSSTATVKFDSNSAPGIRGKLRFEVSLWNDWNK